MAAPETRGTPPSTRALAGLFALALAVRLLALAELAGSPWSVLPLGDARAYDQWARELAGGAWLGSEVFYQAPLYPYLLGVVYALLGPAPGVVRVAQCLLGALAAVWVARGTARFASPRAALLAGGVMALYAPAIWYDLQLEKTSLATSLTAWLFCTAATRGSGSGWRAPLAAGVGLGALALLRENALVLALPLGWAFAGGVQEHRKRLVAFAAGMALCLVPVAARNLAVGGVPLPTASNAGVNFYIGNGAEADGQYRPLVAGRGHAQHERADAERIAEELAGRPLSAVGVSRFWLALALREIAEEPGHLAWVLAQKLRLLAHRGEIMDAVALEVFADESVVLRALGWCGFGLLLPLALAGAVLAWRRPGTGPALAAAALLALSIVAFFVVGRFRLGLVPFLCPFAGLALLEGARSARPGATLGALAIGGLLAWWPLPTEGDPRATSFSNLASEGLRRGDHAAAERWAREAWRLDPRSADAAFNLGASLRAQGELQEAVGPYEAAMELEPAYAADCLAELGAIRALSGDPEGARTLLERALALDPRHAGALRFLAALEARARSE
ncbi:MAG TPA: glycosyltransferase family 39 protein [Planctomycetota bacterium]